MSGKGFQRKSGFAALEAFLRYALILLLASGLPIALLPAQAFADDRIEVNGTTIRVGSTDSEIREVEGTGSGYMEGVTYTSNGTEVVPTDFEAGEGYFMYQGKMYQLPSKSQIDASVGDVATDFTDLAKMSGNAKYKDIDIDVSNGYVNASNVCFALGCVASFIPQPTFSFALSTAFSFASHHLLEMDISNSLAYGDNYEVQDWLLDMYRTQRCIDVHFDKTFEYLDDGQFDSFKSYLKELDERNKKAQANWNARADQPGASISKRYDIETKAEEALVKAQTIIKKIAGEFKDFDAGASHDIYGWFKESGVGSHKPWENQEDMIIPPMAKSDFDKSLVRSQEGLEAIGASADDLGGYMKINHIVDRESDEMGMKGFKMTERDLSLEEIVGLGQAIYASMADHDWRLMVTEALQMRDNGFTGAMALFSKSFQAKMGMTEDIHMSALMWAGLVRPGHNLTPMDPEVYRYMYNQQLDKILAENPNPIHALGLTQEEWESICSTVDGMDQESAQEYITNWLDKRFTNDTAKAWINYQQDIFKLALSGKGGVAYYNFDYLVPTKYLGKYEVPVAGNLVTTNVGQGTAYIAADGTAYAFLDKVQIANIALTTISIAQRGEVLEAHEKARAEAAAQHNDMANLVNGGVDLSDTTARQEAEQAVAEKRRQEQLERQQEYYDYAQTNAYGY